VLHEHRDVLSNVLAVAMSFFIRSSGTSKICDEIIKMAVFAKLKNLSIGVCQRERVLTDIKITGYLLLLV